MPPELSDEVMEEAMSYLKNQYLNHGVKLEDYPALNKLFVDEAFRSEVIRKTQSNYKISYQSAMASLDK